MREGKVAEKSREKRAFVGSFWERQKKKLFRGL